MDALLALGERFGPNLTLTRFGSSACFAFDGQSAILEYGDDGFVRATFADRPSRDLATDRTWIARYRGSTGAYALGEAGCKRIARDVADFFSGIREPRFAFAELS